jgi:hypothetical protein
MKLAPRYLRIRNVRQLALAVLAAGLAACAATGPDRVVATVPDLPYEASVGGARLLLVRESIDAQKTPAGEREVRVQYLWDYVNGVAVRRTLALDGSEIERAALPGMTLNATEAERSFAFDLVRRDPRLAARITPTTTLYGGFSYREAASACDAGSRCIHVVGSDDQGRRHVLHAIVDLMRSRVVDPDYDPGMRGIEQDGKTGAMNR